MTCGRSAPGRSARSFFVCASVASVVGHTSGQLVKPKNSKVQCPCSVSDRTGAVLPDERERTAAAAAARCSVAVVSAELRAGLRAASASARDCGKPASRRPNGDHICEAIDLSSGHHFLVARMYCTVLHEGELALARLRAGHTPRQKPRRPWATDSLLCAAVEPPISPSVTALTTRSMKRPQLVFLALGLRHDGRRGCYSASFLTRTRARVSLALIERRIRERIPGGLSHAPNVVCRT